MTAFGISPLGKGLGPFGGPGLITLLGVLPQSLNTFVFVFDKEPKRLDDQSPCSGVNIKNYALEAVNPTIIADNGDIVIPAGAVVPRYQPRIVSATADILDPKQIIIATDTDLEPRVLYEASVVGPIQSIDDDIFAGPTTFPFTGRLKPNTPTPIELYEERFRDLDYILNPNPAQPEEKTQVYRFDASGDLSIAGNEASLRKRLFRRITTQPGEFAFLPNYGVGLQLKTLARQGQLQQLSNLVSAQVLLEPDVIQAAAATAVRPTSGGGIVTVSLKVVQDDARTRTFLFEFPAGTDQ